MPAVIDRFMRGRIQTSASKHVQIRSACPIDMKDGIDDTERGIIRRFQKHCRTGIAEKDAGIAVLIVGNRGHLIGADDEHFLCTAGLDEASAGIQGKKKSGTCGYKIESPCILRPDLVLNDASRRREKHVGRNGRGNKMPISEPPIPRRPEAGAPQEEQVRLCNPRENLRPISRSRCVSTRPMYRDNFEKEFGTISPAQSALAVIAARWMVVPFCIKTIVKRFANRPCNIFFVPFPQHEVSYSLSPGLLERLMITTPFNLKRNAAALHNRSHLNPSQQLSVCSQDLSGVSRMRSLSAQNTLCKFKDNIP
jgi:hypothetical protein